MISTLDFENVCPDATVPEETLFHSWISAAVAATGEFCKPVNVSIRVVDEAESAELNLSYRGKDYPTNVLSFSSDLPEAVASMLEELPLGDLVICAPVVTREAHEQGKAVANHWAHMVIHGVLHLSGLDHQDDDEAERMETLEKQILATLGIADPYEDRNDSSGIQTC